MLGHQNKPS